MKKALVALSLLSCFWGFPQGLTQSAYAQPANLSYDQVLSLTKQNLEEKNYEAAEQNAQKLLAIAESSDETSQAQLTLGETFYLSKKYEPAIMEWNKLLAPEENETDDTLQKLAHLNIARSYTAKGNFAKAIPHYQTGIKLFDGEAEKPQSEEEKGKKTIVSIALANALYQTEQYEIAQQEFGKIVESNQDLPPVLMLALTRASEIDLMKFKIKKSVAGFEQVLALAIKEKAPLTEKYARSQIQWGNLNRGVWEGGGPGNLKVDLRGSADDLRMNTIVQTLNDIFLDDLMLKMLEE